MTTYFNVTKRDDGVTFYDMSPLLANPVLRRKVIADLRAHTINHGATHVLGLETRGYIVGAWLADALGTPFIRVPKLASAMKVPGELVTKTYDLEYKKGEAIALPVRSIPPHARVIIADDLYATGGTMNAAAELVKTVEPTAHVVGRVVLLQLGSTPIHGLTSLFYTGSDGIPVCDDIPELVDTDKPTVDDKRAVLMYHPSMERIAVSIDANNRARIRRSEIQWASFPDGWPNVRFEHRDTLEGRHVVFLASFHDKNLTMEQISMLIALPRQGIKSLRVFIPYYGPGITSGHF
jgi:adenine phosphoribosyltransferase